MRTEFERGFYKASLYTASKNILFSSGNHEPTLCEILNLIKTKRRKARALPQTVSTVEEEAAKIRGIVIRQKLNKDGNSDINDREYQKGITLLKNEMKRKGIKFAKYYLFQNS